MAASNDGALLKVYDQNGNVVANASHASSGSSSSNDNQIAVKKEVENKPKSESGSSDVGDVWGIQQSDAGFETLADMKTLGGVYMGMTPFKNMSIISIAISSGLALTFLIVGIFILIMLAGFGAAHPNAKKGWDLLRGAQGKIAALGLVFALALFVIIVIFFTLTIFGKIIVMMA